jgi:uncharacterized protein
LIQAWSIFDPRHLTFDIRPSTIDLRHSACNLFPQMSSPNHLITSTSPYLLQHAYNPVEWYPWSEEALSKAKSEDKLILVSIGYSACHWCHVMEHESFEDFEVAEIMNQHFVCIKVDREERPDIDQVYMSAVQLMTGRGGWPLNCFTLPDGRPVYGGTYFPKKQWINILLNLADAYKNDKPKFVDYAQQLTDGVNKMDLVAATNENPEFDFAVADEAVLNWKKLLDNHEGGPARAPKFPLPNNYIFLLRYSQIKKDDELLNHIQLTLKKMAYGGIYDQIGGGFARYSVDGIWKVPHFEKMLYDNAQLVSLYAEAYRYFKDPIYKQIVYQTLEFVERELTGNEGNFYSALDADSEGEEGKFYVWKKEELETILGNDFNLFADYFNVNDRGFWEHENFILLRNDDDQEIAKRNGMDVSALRNKIKLLSKRLLIQREKRIRPGLDDKTLASWNGLMISGYLDAYDSFGDEQFLNAAKKNLDFILREMVSPDGGLNHNYKNSISNINAYLEDYAFVIQALIKMYQCTFELKWIEQARKFSEYVELHFSDEPSGLFYFTSDLDPPLITRKMENQDNVIPASNSQMAINLFQLGHYFENYEWIERSQKMAMNLKSVLTGYGSGYSNWLIHWMQLSEPLRELVICGENAISFRNQLISVTLPPGILIAGIVNQENIPMTISRLKKGETLIYICVDHSCQLPVNSVEDAKELLN